MAKSQQELVFKSAQELGELIRKREVSPVEVVQAHLDRIDELNPSLNAIITVTRDEALKRAHEAEKEIRGSRYIGPLHGIPYGPKDILATKGILTTNGSKVTKDWVPDYESTVTQRLNQAGAILIGKVNLLEFAMGSGTLSGFGPVRNPWHLAYSPAGSSSGSGAALAARMLPLSIGTDTGGSIRAPAAANGIVGLKPTYGRVSRFGVTTLSRSLDNAGPMTRTVADNAALLQVIAGWDPLDETSADEPVPNYSAALTGDVRGLRIGVPTNYFYEGTSPEVDAGVRQAVKALADRGAEIVDVEVPHAKYAGSAGWIIAMADGACFHEKRLKEHFDLFDPVIQERMGAAKFYLATDYIKAQRIRAILVQEMKNVFRKCDVMAVPGSKRVTGKLETADIARSDVKPGSKPTPYMDGTTFLGNMTGLPAMTMACGYAAGPPKLPISIQFYGRPFDELTLFRVGHAYQGMTDWHQQLPPLTKS